MLAKGKKTITQFSSLFYV